MIYCQQQWGKPATAKRPVAAGSQKDSRDANHGIKKVIYSKVLDANQQLPVKASLRKRKDASIKS
jgi:hypothetical protein